GSATRLPETVLSVPPYSAMPLASTGVCTVLWSNVLPESSPDSDHMARPSSPVLRMKLFDTTEFVTPVWKLRPSAIWSAMTLSVMRRFVIGRWSQMPTWVWCMYSPSTVELLSAPPMPLTWSVSMRSRTSPSIANPDRWTLLLPPSETYLP